MDPAIRERPTEPARDVPAAEAANTGAAGFAKVRSDVVGVSPRLATPSGSRMDDRHIEHLNEGEVVERIGELLAIAIARSGRLLRAPAAHRANVPGTAAYVVDSVALIRDPVERKLAGFLKHAGPCRPSDIAKTLGLARWLVGRKLRRLRAAGICEAVGKTRASHYQLRADYQAN
ncbi:MAG: hypothetical protein FJW31_31305 [Acidobacteria bacterium]|nr:hypothetical protein [Acidobacteriota bacterium]